MAHDILIVDDETDIRMLIGGVLRDEGYATREASDSGEALGASRPSSRSQERVTRLREAERLKGRGAVGMLVSVRLKVTLTSVTSLASNSIECCQALGLSL